MQRTAVLLLQMGGPRNLEEVESYIRSLFQDKNLVRLPWPLSLVRTPLSWWVAKRRSPKVKQQYVKIGGGSPNNRITQEQAIALEEALAQYGDFRCYAGLTYTPPGIQQAWRQSLNDGCSAWIVLPLFPHYCVASTGAVLAELDRCCTMEKLTKDFRVIERWWQHQSYLQLLADRTLKTLKQAEKKGGCPSHLLISAHGIPVSYQRAGDPYVQEIEACVFQLKTLLPLNQKVSLAYQSRATPVKWVGPSTIEMLERLGAKGERNIVVLPISFVNDHIETLYEIDQQLKEIAEEAGVVHYQRVPMFNTDEEFIQVLKSIILEQ